MGTAKIPTLIRSLALVAVIMAAAGRTVGMAADADQRPMLWDRNIPLPRADQVPALQSVTFHVIKSHEPDRDGGYHFLHGVALEWHRGRLYATWGHNRGRENTGSEEARGTISADGGRTWGDPFTIDAGDGELAVSHGVLLSWQDRLWAFQGAFEGERQNVHTRAYLLNETTGRWEFQAVVVRDGFWPMEPPKKMADGNWIMGGFLVGQGNPAAVAISDGDDLLQWSVLSIELPAERHRIWAESTTLICGSRIVNIARCGPQAVALAANSTDFGRTWTPSVPSNLPMATSKPFSGTFSNGCHYLIGTTTRDSGPRRSPLTIALSASAEPVFSRVLRIRDSVHSDAAVESHPTARLAYPCAVEHEGRLYVGYSNSGGRSGMNINSAELAVIDMDELR